ncbi:MAG: hypothetical protein KAH01_03950 [Caldisericia bacterium]|nr:hypothetical protein [Caldisericia bacterium]
MENPYSAKTPQGNKPLIGNDFRLISGNRNKADKAICKAQEVYKKGLCHDNQTQPPVDP